MRIKRFATMALAALALSIGASLAGGTGTAEAIVHPAVPICNAPLDSEAGGVGIPGGGLPDEAGRGAGGPGGVANGLTASGTNACP